MIFFVLAWEEWVADGQLIQDAPERPHVNRRVVGDAKHDFGRTVETRLDVCVDFLVFEASTAKVNDFDAGLVDLAQQNVLGFEVAVHDVVFPHVVERNEDLNRETFDQTQREALKVVHLDEVVEVHAQQLER